MKAFKIFLAISMAVLSVTAFAQDKQSLKQETVKVWGNCEMCQKRIEKAAKAAGATSAKWNVDTKILSVAYNPSKASLAKIEKSVADTGYDTGNEVASEEAYKSLPECCQYDRKGPQTTDPNTKKE